jgi:hypothetical protein
VSKDIEAAAGSLNELLSLQVSSHGAVHDPVSPGRVCTAVFASCATY